MTNPTTTAAPAAPDFSQQVELYVTHLQRLAEVFNEHSQEIRLGVRMDVDGAIRLARSGDSLASIRSFFNREDDSGVLHAEQLTTALDCIARMIENPGQSGIVLGAMQSGKTTTSLAMQFAGPAIYALTGRRIYPLYLATSHTGQQDQTNIELIHFLNYYGLVRIVRDAGFELPTGVSIDSFFLHAPTIEYYRSHVLRNALGDVHIGPRLEDFVARRVQGQGVQEIADLCHRAHEQGFEPLLLIDEPQYGASDRIVTNDEGHEERRSCVMLQIFQAIEAALGRRDAHSFIGLSATPYDTHELESVWVVRQKLTEHYRGFNYFGGRHISDGITIEPPATMGFSEFARDFSLPFFANISLSVYDGSPARFNTFVRKTAFTGDQTAYQTQVRETLRASVLAMLRRATGPTGVCLRLFNNNARAQDFIRQLDLERDGVEVINYFGSEYTGVSVKRAIRDRRQPDRPFVIVVTNRARMGDAFPRQVRWFLDFSKRAADLNALLQGLLGRACGYSKQSTVVLSDENAQIVTHYKDTLGGYIYTTSRHSVVVGGYRRGPLTNLIRLSTDMDDSVVQAFFERIQNEIVDVTVLQDRPTLSTIRNRGGFRTGPILRIAEELSLFNHLEQEDFRERLFPSIHGNIRVARAGDSVPHARDSNRSLHYTLDADGNCRYTFRWTSGNATHSGLASRGYGQRDATDRARAADFLEPQIHLDKYDPDTGEVFFDKDAADRRPGNWRVRMITLPLIERVRELQPGIASLPSALNVHRPLMTPQEEEAAGFSD